MRGLASENHAVKQGFFLASVLVLSRFKAVIDFEKYIKWMFGETKVNQAMKSAEANTVSLGRMMCLSALIEARTYLVGGVNVRTLKVIVGCLVELYTKHEFLQESIAAILTKLLVTMKDQRQHGLQALEIVVDTLIFSKPGEATDFKASILSDSNRLALYLRLKGIYKEHYAGLSKEYEEVFDYKVLADKKSLRAITGLITRQTYLYPRLHSSLSLLLREI